MKNGDSVRLPWPVLHLLLFWSGPINLLARLEPVTIWKNCTVYKTDMERYPWALTSHMNLEMIKMALAVFTAESFMLRTAHRGHLEISLAKSWKCNQFPLWCAFPPPCLPLSLLLSPKAGCQFQTKCYTRRQIQVESCSVGNRTKLFCESDLLIRWGR